MRSLALTLVLSLLVSGSCNSTRGCNDSCESARNGLCNDGGPGTVYYDCMLGTDCTDCGERPEGSTTISRPGCSDTCESARNGMCNDGGAGTVNYEVDCALGTDCTDCGERFPPPPPVAAQPSRQTTSCSDTCKFARDGVCNDGGPGTAYFDCDPGTDCTDCGAYPRTSLEATASGATRPSPSDQAVQLLTVGVIGVGFIAAIACCTLCAFVWFIRSRELEGDPVFKAQKARLPMEVDVRMAQEDVEMVTVVG
jgi:hypothetical protein